jgi:hypothetical protein
MSITLKIIEAPHYSKTLWVLFYNRTMGKVKSTKTLRSFLDSSLNLSEMKKINGGQEGYILGSGPIAFAEFLWCLQQDS